VGAWDSMRAVRISQWCYALIGTPMLLSVLLPLQRRPGGKRSLTGINHLRRCADVSDEGTLRICRVVELRAAELSSIT
jgi:hypothetical protein